MDIKKFITSDKIENNYNNLIQKELDASNKGVSDEYECLYRVSECDFLLPTIGTTDMLNDPNIKEFESLCSDPDSLCYSGPMIKRYLDPNKNNKRFPIKNYYVVSVIDTKLRPKDIIKDDDTRDNMRSQNGFYVIKTSESLFYLNKKTGFILSNATLKNDNPLDRIVLGHSDLWVSGMFILELYKKISCYDANNVDPFFKYPEDLLDIYDRSNVMKQSVKHLIDMVDIETLKSIEKNKIEKTIILHKDQKYTILEYALLKMMDNTHSVIVYQMRSLIVHLACFTYHRPIFFIARIIGFDKRYPGIYNSLIEIKHDIDIDPSVDISSMESMYHVDMYILNHLIKQDDGDRFVEYISTMGIVKKFKQDSKTTEKIVEWIIEHKAMRIVNILLECMVLSSKFRYRIIFLTEEFNLLGRDFIERYIVDKRKQHDKKNNTKSSGKQKPDTQKKDALNTEENDKNKNDNSPNQRVKITKKDEISEENDRCENTHSNNADDEATDSLDHDPKDNRSDTESSEDVQSEEESRILDPEDQNLILANLDYVVKRGLKRSFYMILKVCPYILKNDFREDGNILHTIDSDLGVDILEIVLKMNPSLIDEKDSKGRTPLVVYAERGLHKAINKLIKHGADYEITDDSCNTFVHKLCENGNLDILQGVIRNVLDIIDNRNDKLMTPCMVAANNGHEEVFYVLKGLNANMSLRDIYGNTVYHYICRSRICPGVIIENQKNKFGFTPKDYCNINHKFYYFQNNKI